MEKVLHFYQTYGMEIIGVLLLLFIVISCVQLHKINVVKKRMDGIAEQVKNYLTYVMVDGEEQQREPMKAVSVDKQEAESRKREQEAEQNRLISSVLEEIFP